MESNSKTIFKLKKKSQRWPGERGLARIKSTIIQSLPAFFVLWLLRNVLVKNEYRLKRESIKFFQLSNRAYGSNRLRKCDRLLLISFRLIASDFEVGYLDLIRKSVQLTLTDSSRRGESSDAILFYTKQLRSTMLDATSWYQLSRGLFSLGYFRAAWAAREKSLDQSVSEGFSSGASITEIHRAIQACLERRDNYCAKSLLKNKFKSISAKRLSEIQDYLNLMEGFIDRQGGDSLPSNVANRDVLEELVDGKTIALVGPGVPQGSYLKEIDEQDTVIRIKFTDDGMLDRFKSHGTRTDISFIGAIDSFASQSLLLPQADNKLKLILSANTSRHFSGVTPVYVIESEGDLYRTTATSGIRTLLEVVKNYPSKLKVYGFDFYTTLTPYSKEVTEFYENSSWRFGHPNDFVANGVYFKFARARDFSVHDPVSNFCFAQNLYKAGLFDIEPYGKSILELTPYQYVERLEEMLGDW